MIKSDSLPIGKVLSPEDMGECIRTRRKQQGATQSEFASLCGVGVRFISDLENGKPTIQLGKTLQVLKYLGLELSVQARGWRGRDQAE